MSKTLNELILLPDASITQALSWSFEDGVRIHLSEKEGRTTVRMEHTDGVIEYKQFDHAILGSYVFQHGEKLYRLDVVMESAVPKPGMYLEFFHGRKCKEEELDDWGEEGPIVGPLDFCHTTYGEDICVSRRDLEVQLSIDSGLIRIDDVYYGDISVQHVTDMRSYLDDFHRFMSLEQLRDKISGRA